MIRKQKSPGRGFVVLVQATEKTAGRADSCRLIGYRPGKEKPPWWRLLEQDQVASRGFSHQTNNPVGLEFL